MIFGTYWFVAFCLVFFPGYWLLGFSRRLRQGWLLLACFSFHWHFAGPAGVFPIIVLSLQTFAAGLSRQRAAIVLSIVLNVAALCFYKYFHFLSLRVLGFAMPSLGAWVDQRGAVMLPGSPPLAISFFIFELVHYLYDVLHGNAPLRRITDFASFIFFFPSLVAGPIKRYENFMPELGRGLAAVSVEQMMAGLLRIARGYFLKIVLADFLTGFIGYYESHFEALTLFMRWTVFLSLGFRIWFDFSGYSDIAIGLALMMGIALPENFNWPYAALNIRDFWHRWHISLSSWIRDYVYIPLGGNRVSLSRKILNGIVAFGLCGLWHGPAWHFIFWGLYHGLGLALSSNYRSLLGSVGEPVHRFFERNPHVAWLLTFLFVAIGWVFFFYPLGRAFQIIGLLFSKRYLDITLLLIVLISPWLLSWPSAGWRGLLPLRRSIRAAVLPLRPAPVFAGVALGFLFCCLAGRYPQTHAFYRDFVRFHEAINPQSAFYPTASQVKTLAESTLPKDKIIVVLGGDSVFLGLRQNVDEVWTIELQKQLGDRFAVFNLGMPDGMPSGTGAVAFNMISMDYPRVIYAFSELPLWPVRTDGGDPYRYIFWDAYYKGYTHYDADRLRQIEACRSAELHTTDGQELHVGAYLDSFTAADDLWTWVGYRWLWTVWSDKTAATPFQARQFYADEHDNAEINHVNVYVLPNVLKPVNADFVDMVHFKDGVPVANPFTWTPLVDAATDSVPSKNRGQTLACLHWICPWTSAKLNKDELAAQAFCYASLHQAYVANGYHALEYGKDYPGEEFADGSHLDAVGGRHLARQMAPEIRAIAQALHYFPPDGATPH